MYEKEKRELLIDAMKKLAFLYRSYGKIGNAEEIERQVEMEEKEERKNGQWKDNNIVKCSSFIVFWLTELGIKMNLDIFET